jgi:hypothetical protein
MVDVFDYGLGDGMFKQYRATWDIHNFHNIQIQSSRKIDAEQVVKVTYRSKSCRKKEIGHESNTVRGLCYSYTLKIVFLSNETVNLIREHG